MEAQSSGVPGAGGHLSSGGPGLRALLLVMGAMAQSAASAASTASAASAAPLVQPRELHTVGATAQSASGAPLVQPRELRSVGGLLDVTLVLDQHLLHGPGFDVWTRAYNGTVPAPTLRIKAGDKLRIKIINRLGPNAPGPCPLDYFGCINTTNLHTHGFHVSPKCGNNPAEPDTCSDNVLVDIPPGSSRQYEYNMIPQHAAGTFWYHPHVEGNTAVQVGAGAAGAIVIEDGPLDSVPGWLAHMDEKVMLLQEMFWMNCGGDDHHHSGHPGTPGGPNPPPGTPLPTRFKGCPGYPGLEAAAEGNLSKVMLKSDKPLLWYFMINGIVEPRIELTAGVWQRWRMVMGGAVSSCSRSVFSSEASSKRLPHRTPT